jgi:hypothetical protein
MSYQSALNIFEEEGLDYPIRALEIILNSDSLDEIPKIMTFEETSSNANQFVSHRLRQLYAGDSEFKKITLEKAKFRFKRHGVPNNIIEFHISEGGGVDSSSAILTYIDIAMQEKKSSIVENREAYLGFFQEADYFLFEVLKEYVSDKS